MIKHTLSGINNEELKQLISLLVTLENKPYTIMIIEQSKEKNFQIRQYYFGTVLGLIEDLTGQDKDDLHDLFKKRYGVKSTENLCDEDLLEFAYKVRAWSEKELDMRVPKFGNAST